MQHKTLPPQLAREGEMMLSALLADLQEAGVQHLICTRDPRLPICNNHVKTVPATDNIWETWRKCMEASAMAWIIAPETDGILYELTRMAHTAGCVVTGCTLETVQLAASKCNTIQHLTAHNISCIPVINDTDAVSANRNGWVVKPDDGVGAEGCCFFPRLEQMLTYVRSQKKRMIIQEFIPGIAASMSILCHAGRALLLASNRQMFHFSNGRGHLQGVIVNGLPEYATQFNEIANDIADSLPGLSGYVGVDVVISDNGPLVVEINPRLTTAYSGLRRSLGKNPAEWILSIYETGFLPELEMMHGLPVTVSL